MSYRPFKVGDLVRTVNTATHRLDYGIGVIVQIGTMPAAHGATQLPPITFLVSWVKKGFRQWRGENEIRRLQ